jgi:hypothetical protein
MSAFYANAVLEVDLSAWNASFPRSVVTALKPPGSNLRLMPDYLALRPTARGLAQYFDWAVVEAKGTKDSLVARQTCPRSWSSQARNVVVEVNGQPIRIPRHLVIATRVNPNGFRPKSRRIQIRAWNNSAEPEDQKLASVAAVEIVAAHLFGLFKSLRLPEYARAIAFSTQVRAESRSGLFRDDAEANIGHLHERAEEEFRRNTRIPIAAKERLTAAEVPIETELGSIAIDISEPLMALTRAICRTETSEAADVVLWKADSQLDEWENSRRVLTHETRNIVLPFGVELRFPPEFERRR